MQKSQINKYIKLWKEAPRVQIEEDSNIADIYIFLKEHFGNETTIVEIPECNDVNNAWNFGMFLETKNPNVLTAYICSNNELPTIELTPDNFFRGIPFNYLILNDNIYLNDNYTGERIKINEYL